MKEIHYVSKAETKEYKKEMDLALKKVLSNLTKKSLPGFQISLVGSTKRNLVLRKGDSPFDVDYKLILFKSGETDAEYRETIRLELENVLGKNWETYNSTSVITVKKFNGKLEVKSFDIALADHVDNLVEIARLNKNANKFVWEPTPSSEDHVEKMSLIKDDMWDYLRDEYKHLRSKEWDKPNDIKKPSHSLFVEAVNNTYNHFYN